jgi:hypothetical protein
VRVLFLDVDGVLNRVGYHPPAPAPAPASASASIGLRSWIEPELAQRLCEVVRAIGAVIVLASDWRIDRTLEALREELRTAGIDAALIGVTPVLPGRPRWREIEAWMTEAGVGRDAIVIVDDQHDMGQLADRFVRTRSLTGLDDTAAQAIVAVFATT